MDEQWATVDYDSRYQVSNYGQVRGPRRLLKWRIPNRLTMPLNSTYPSVLLCKGAAQKTFPVHILVARHFIGPCPEGMEVNHKDRNRHNPRADNLEYLTPSQNVQHSYDNGRESLKGERNPAAKLTESDVKEIRSIYRRGVKGLGQVALAHRFGVTQSAIWRILQGLVWKEV